MGEVVRLPLQIEANPDRGASAFTCATLSGVVVGKLEGLGPEDLGSALAELIHESIPAPPNAKWRIVLPRGNVLEADELHLTLRDLFESEVPDALSANREIEKISRQQGIDPTRFID